MRIAQSLQELRPAGSAFSSAYQQFVLEWVLFAGAEGKGGVDPVVAVVRSLSMTTLPGGTMLVRRLGVSPEAIELLEEQARLAPKSRAHRFLLAKLALDRLPDDRESGFVRRVKDALPGVSGVLWGLPAEMPVLEALAAQGLVAAPDPLVELDPHLAPHYQGEAWLALIDLLRWRWREERVTPTREQLDVFGRACRRALALLNTPGSLQSVFRGWGGTLWGAAKAGDSVDRAEVVAVWEEAVALFRRRVATPTKRAGHAFGTDWGLAAFQEEGALIRSLDSLTGVLIGWAGTGPAEAESIWQRAIEAIDEALTVGESFASFGLAQGYRLLAQKAQIYLRTGRLEQGEATLARGMPQGLSHVAFSQVAAQLALRRGDLEEARRRCAIGLEHNPGHAKLLEIQEQSRDP